MNTGDDFYNDIEELVGTHPSRDALRNATYALIADGHGRWADSPNSEIFKAAIRNTEKTARKYEQDRSIHFHVGGTGECWVGCNKF